MEYLPFLALYWEIVQFGGGLREKYLTARLYGFKVQLKYDYYLQEIPFQINCWLLNILPYQSDWLHYKYFFTKTAIQEEWVNGWENQYTVKSS